MAANRESQSYSDEIVAGRNPVLEALRSGRPVQRVYFSAGEKTGSALAIRSLCRERGIPVKEISAQKLDFICKGVNHQGIALVVASAEYYEVDDLLLYAGETGAPPFFLILDGIEDPHNFGAIIRTAEAVGVHGIIIPKRRSADLSVTAYKASAGALHYVKVARVPNLVQAIDKLKKAGMWIYAADMDGKVWFETDLTGPIALVIGAEGKGVSRLVKEVCDFTLSLPMQGKIQSLNASVAAGIMMYEITRQRMQDS